MDIYSDIPLWSLLLWAGFVVFISIYLYQRKYWVEEISSLSRIVLITLRSLGLFLLGLLLCGILLKGFNKKIEKPIIATIIDNSSSMLNYKDSSSVITKTKEFIQKLKEKEKKDFNQLFFTLKGKKDNLDSLSFNEQQTNLSHSLNELYNKYYGRNIGAILLLSDGNFNKGASPLMIAKKFKNIPIYTIGVGDTVQKVDQLIQSVQVNQIAFLGNKFPVEVSIEGNRVGNQPFQLELLEDGKVIQRKELQHNAGDYSLVKTRFLLNANTIGVHEYTLKVTALPHEYNLSNNQKSFFVEVLDDRKNILLVAEGMNPDIGSIKEALITQKNFKLKVVTSNDLPHDLSSYDLIIWGSPGARGLHDNFTTLKNFHKSIWYLITPSTPISALNQLSLKATFQATTNVDKISASYNQDFNLIHFSSELQKNLNKFPPLTSKFGKINYAKTNQILAYQRIGPIVKKAPLIFFGKSEKKKFAVTYGIGLWRWRIEDYHLHKDHTLFNELIQKTVQYLLVTENKSRFRIKLPSIASDNKDFIVHSEFYNASLQPITEPTIHFKLTTPKGKKFDYSFLPQQIDYSLNLGKLEQGHYHWMASTEYAGKKYVKKGEFGIRQLTIEQQDTKANHHLLIQLAENNNGKFARLSNSSSILKDLAANTQITPISYSSTIYHKLINYWWILLLIIAIFTSEWAMRKYLGGY